MSTLRSQSPRTRARRQTVTDAGARANARDGRCMAAVLVPAITCGGPLDPQHVIPRGVDRTLAADEDNIIGCCRRHHDWIGDNPTVARSLGLHGHYGDDLAELAHRRMAGAS